MVTLRARSLLILTSYWLLTISVKGQSNASDFDYDRSAPLNLKTSIVRSEHGATILDVIYDSPKGGKVNAYLVEPTGSARNRAAVVFGHWGPGDRTEFLAEALLYARVGAVSILINQPWTRDLDSRRDFRYEDVEIDLGIARQAVVDLRRAFDVVLARPDVDRTRVAYIGHSFGAQWGAILAAVDKRMKTAILIGGVGSSADMWERNDDPDDVKLRQDWPVEKRTPYLQRYSAVDAIRFIPHAAPVSLYFQFAQFERRFNDASMNAYFRAASEPKHVEWYPTGHELNDPRALADRARWLEREIRLRGAVKELRDTYGTAAREQ